MLRLAVLSARGRLGTFTGALIAVIASSILVMAGGMTLESALRNHPPVERYAATAAVVTGEQTVGKEDPVDLSQRVRVSAALPSRLASVPGVRAAIGDVSAPSRLGRRATVAHGWGGAARTAPRLGRRATVAHGWGSAALTPYRLTAGRAPGAPGEVVTGYRGERLGTKLRLTS